MHSLHTFCQFWHVPLRMPLISRNGMEIEVEEYALLVLGIYLVCDPVFNLSVVVADTLQLKEKEKGVKYPSVKQRVNQIIIR